MCVIGDQRCLGSEARHAQGSQHAYCRSSSCVTGRGDFSQVHSALTPACPNNRHNGESERLSVGLRPEELVATYARIMGREPPESS